MKKPVEVFKVFSVYKTFSKRKKLGILKVLKAWVEKEIKLNGQSNIQRKSNL